MKVISVLLLLSLTFCDCNDDCKELPDFYTGDFIVKGDYYSSPYFNPSNSDEIIFFFRKEGMNYNNLIKYNFSTKDWVILDSLISGALSQPRWSNSNWICYNVIHDNQQCIRIIKDNGDSARAITCEGSNLFPVISQKEKIIFWNKSLQNSYPYYFVRYFFNTFVQDTLSEVNVLMSETSRLDQICSFYYTSTGLNLGIFNFQTLQFDNLIDFTEKGIDKAMGLTWAPDEKKIYFTSFNQGLYIYHFESKTIEKLIDFCDSKKYLSISCSPDNDKIVAELHKYNAQIDENGDYTGYILETSELIFIDIMTLDEKKINFNSFN